jgi:TolB-like protein
MSQPVSADFSAAVVCFSPPRRLRAPMECGSVGASEWHAFRPLDRLRMISRVSSLAYKGRRGALPDLGDELGVEWVLVASIAKSGRELRVNAQLVDANSDENRWAHSFNGDARRILSVQPDIAEEVAKQVQQAIRKR